MENPSENRPAAWRRLPSWLLTQTGGHAHRVVTEGFSAAGGRGYHYRLLAVLAESGFEGVTVEAVAQRAGVARSTVYRRYPGKPELMVTVLQRACQAPVDDTDTGSVEEDLVAVGEGLRLSMVGSDLGRAMTAVVSAAARHPEVAAAHESFVATRRQVALAAVRRGVERGELDPDLDPDMVVDLVVGPVFYRLLVRRQPVSSAWVRRLVARVVQGCAPRPAPPDGP